MKKMKAFDIDYTDQLSEQQVRYLLKSELERNKLLIRQNNFALFRYEAIDDTMVVLYLAQDGSISHMDFDHYSEVAPEVMFDKKEHQRLTTTLKRIVNDTDYPKIGAVDFFYKNGTGITLEYSCLFDEIGRVVSIVGQHIDVYLTHDRMIATIQSLNAQAAITDALRQSYETMLTFNMEDYSFKIIQATSEVRLASMKVKTVIELAELFCKYFIEPAYQEKFRQFVNEGTISDRLEGNRYLSFEYMTKNIGWCRARIMPAEIDSSGHVSQGIFTTETADDHHRELSVLRVAASTDGLTGLLNRNTGEKAITEALQNKKESIFLLFDCDFFKNINDKLGHPTGDQVLIEVSKALKETFEQETVLRLGGDEFAVFVTSKKLVEKAKDGNIKQLLQPLHIRLQQIHIKQLKGQKPSLSCGAVTIPANCNYTLNQIYTIADQKLYEAKATHNGAIAHTIMHEPE